MNVVGVGLIYAVTSLVIDVPRVRASDFIRLIKQEVARTQPGIFECFIEGEGYSDFVVKFRHKMGRFILCEFVSSVLGIRLGLHVPQVAIVEIDNRLSEYISDTDLSNALISDPGPHFGSMLVSGQYKVPLPGMPLPERLIPQAIDLFAFDMLIQNPDRTFYRDRGKPNLLTDDQRLVVIDHDLSFSFLATIEETPKPWKLRDGDLAIHHIYYSALNSFANDNAISFEGFIERMCSVTKEEVGLLLNSIPLTWIIESNWPKEIALYIEYVQDNADNFNHGLLEVFA